MELLREKFGLTYERFSAIGPASMNMEEYMKQHNIHTLKHLSHGQVGCFMSHYRILEDIVKNNYSHAIILEDDVSFLPPFLTTLPAVLEELEILDTPWDIVMLGQERYIDGKDQSLPGSKYLVNHSSHWGQQVILYPPVELPRFWNHSLCPRWWNTTIFSSTSLESILLMAFTTTH